MPNDFCGGLVKFLHSFPEIFSGKVVIL
jgi:hypothetical protein